MDTLSSGLAVSTPHRAPTDGAAAKAPAADRGWAMPQMRKNNVSGGTLGCGAYRAGPAKPSLRRKSYLTGVLWLLSVYPL
jgi:hypothetical protein